MKPYEYIIHLDVADRKAAFKCAAIIMKKLNLLSNCEYSISDTPGKNEDPLFKMSFVSDISLRSSFKELCLGFIAAREIREAK